MKMTKKNLFITLLLLTSVVNTYTMDQPEPKEKKSSLPKWAKSVGTFILGEKKLKKGPEMDELSILISELPKDIQNVIMGFLQMDVAADSLVVATNNIRAFTQVNKELNTLINDPQFCLTLIKKLSRQFNCSDFIACKTLQTKQAKYQLDIQNKFLELCKQTNAKEDDFALLIYQGADVNFSYDSGQMLVTPLMVAASNGSNTLLYLIKAGVNVNQTTSHGLTALMFAAYKNQTWGIEELLKNTTININQQDINGNTALMYCFMTKSNLARNTMVNVGALLTAGADPSIANKKGLSPLEAANKNGDQLLVKLIQAALDKKN